MEVASSVMGPERVFPSAEDELCDDERPVEGALLPAAMWNGAGGGAEDDEEEEDGGDMDVDAEEEEEEEVIDSGAASEAGYYYQPLNQEPDGLNATEPPDEDEEDEEVGAGSHATQLQQVQQRIEVMGLHLPEAPPPDSDEEEDPEGAAAQRSRASIPMDADHVELVKRTMAAVALPSLGVPPWARDISDDQWTDMVQHTLQSRQSAAALRLHRRNVN